MICLHCRKDIPSGEVICPHCGKSAFSQRIENNRDGLAFIMSLVPAIVFWSLLYSYGLDGFNDPGSPYLLKALQTHWICKSIVLVMLWGLVYLCWVMRQHFSEKNMLKALHRPAVRNFITTGVSREQFGELTSLLLSGITPKAAKSATGTIVSARIDGLDRAFKGSESNRNILRALEVLSDLDQHAIQSKFTFVRVFIWLMPILGFMGTILGISAAIMGFTAGMNQSGGSGGVIIEGLGEVTRGLSTAFDTTFIGLICVIPVMFLLTWIEKRYLDTLRQIDDHFIVDILPHILGAEDSASQDTTGAGFLRRHAEDWVGAVNPVLRHLRESLGLLQSQMEGISGVLDAVNRRAIRDLDPVISDETKPTPSKRHLFRRRRPPVNP